MPALRPVPLDLTGRTITNAEAHAHGIRADRLRRRDVSHPHHGVQVLGVAAIDLVGRCRELVQILDERFVFSHTTAALLWGLPLPAALQDDRPLHVAAVGPRGRIRRPGVATWEVGTRMPPVRVREGLLVVAPADVWAQLAGIYVSKGRPLLDLGWLVAIGDRLVTGDRYAAETAALCTMADLSDAAARRAGKRGAKRLVDALALVRVGAQSPLESRVRVGLVLEGLPEPVIQPSIRTARGIRHPDLGYIHDGVVIECQGDHHRTSRRQWLDDLERVQLFEDAGYHPILVGEPDAADGRALAAQLRRRLRLPRENAETRDA